MGEVAGVKPDVEGQGPLEKALKGLKKGDEVVRGMRVRTRRWAGAEITVNALEPNKEGMVLLGPNTEVVFTEYVVDRARGLKPTMSWKMAFGMLGIIFRPTGPIPAAGEYWIEPPGGEKIRLLGTAVYVKVDRRTGTTTVAVTEGRVEIEPKVGDRIEVVAGEWTRIEIGRPPTPPAPIPPNGGPLGPPDFDGLLPPDPPNLNLRLDLPN